MNCTQAVDINHQGYTGCSSNLRDGAGWARCDSKHLRMLSSDQVSFGGNWW